MIIWPLGFAVDENGFGPDLSIRVVSKGRAVENVISITAAPDQRPVLVIFQILAIYMLAQMPIVGLSDFAIFVIDKLPTLEMVVEVVFTLDDDPLFGICQRLALTQAVSIILVGPAGFSVSIVSFVCQNGFR